MLDAARLIAVAGGDQHTQEEEREAAKEAMNTRVMLQQIAKVRIMRSLQVIFADLSTGYEPAVQTQEDGDGEYLSISLHSPVVADRPRPRIEIKCQVKFIYTVEPNGQFTETTDLRPVDSRQRNIKPHGTRRNVRATIKVINSQLGKIVAEVSGAEGIEPVDFTFDLSAEDCRLVSVGDKVKALVEWDSDRENWHVLEMTDDDA